MRRQLTAGVFLCAFTLVLALGCSEEVFMGPGAENRPPEAWLSSGPVEGDTTGYQVHFFWGGWDPDGEVRGYEFIVADGAPFGFDPQDTTGLDKWRRTTAHDSVFRVSAAADARTVSIGGYLFTRYDMTHTFFLRAVDGAGKRSEPVYRSFTAWTLAPTAVIERPRLPASASVQTLARVITFAWSSSDPIDSPANTQAPDSVRYLCTPLVNPAGQYDPSFNIVGDLNAHPERYEPRWSRWIHYRAAGDSGRSTIIGDDEVLEINRSHLFAVQAKDDAGAITGIFDRRTNARQFIVSAQAGPLMRVFEPVLGAFTFLGTNLRPEKVDLPPGVGLRFRWTADASSYGGEIVCFQYGWDVADLNDPGEWESDCSPFETGCAAAWYAGVHVLVVRVVDNAGTESLGQIEVNVVPFPMDRNLLWVDDFPSTDFSQADYAMPTESEHDAFWTALCARASGFDPSMDVYDVSGHGGRPPLITLVGRYRSVVWTFSAAPEGCAWDDVVRFTPESQVGEATRLTVNYLSIFLSKGGHLLTEGRSDRGGGLAMVLPGDAQLMPINIRCEVTGPQDGCGGDTSGVNTMAYHEYCVTVVDKISSRFRSEIDMPLRRETADALELAYRSETDGGGNGLPDTLRLWEEILKPGRFFDPVRRGFTYAEVYDPAYWMSRNGLRSRDCFSPMYRMVARSIESPLHRQSVALWLTKYASVDADGDGGGCIPARSAHIGFELWFFERAGVNRLVDAIFDEWGIRAP